MWIEITENDKYDNTFPPKEIDVLLGDNTIDKFYIGYWTGKQSSAVWYSTSHAGDIIHPTHWQSLPKLPE